MYMWEERKWIWVTDIFLLILLAIVLLLIQAGPVSFGGINPLLPYDPRVKKTKLKPYDRKPRLQVRDGSAGISKSSQSSVWVCFTFHMQNNFCAHVT